MKSLRGPFPLDYEAVNQNVASTAGVFALGYSTPDGRFHTNVVGRSDEDIRAKILGHVGKERQFKFVRLPSTEEAFEAECRLFHSLAPLKSRIHPARPAGTSWVCPVCARGKPLRLT